MRSKGLVLIALTVLAGVLTFQPIATAQTCTDGDLACEEGNNDGEVGVTTPGGDGADGGCPIWNPCNPGYCAAFPSDVAACPPTPTTDSGGVNLPACVYVGGVATNEPCRAPAQPCVGFPDPDVAADPDAQPCGAPAPIVPPYIPPPTAGEAGQEARDNVVWPVVNPGPKGFSGFGETGEGLVLTGGFEHALVTWGYEDWVPLSADASITKTVVVSGVAFSETFTATLEATPVEVRWDTGPNNNAVTRHNPPTTVTCDGPGNTSLHQDLSRPFQDWRSYNGYGGADCRFVWWGLNDDVGSLTTITAELEWDLVLTTNWDGAVTNIGEHLEQYSSGGWVIDLPSAVNVNEGSSNGSGD